MRGTVVLLGAGSGLRLGAGPKAFVHLAGVSMLRRAADGAAAAGLVDRLVVALPAVLLEDGRRELDGLRVPCEVVQGGATRQESCRLALAHVGDALAVAVHDAARPLCPSDVFDRCLAALDRHAAVIPVVDVVDTIRQVGARGVRKVLDRSTLVATQTPQAFRARVLVHAHEQARREGVEATDDAALVERSGTPVAVVDGDPSNIKVTRPVDVTLAEALLAGRSMRA